MLIARSVGWALNALANPPSNRLIPQSNDDYPDSIHEQDLLRRLTHRSGMILSSAELVSLVHPPSSSVRIEKLVSGIQRQLETQGENEVPSKRIGEMVMEGLKGLDSVAYIRFASVYKDFREARDFEEFAGNVTEVGKG